MDRNNFLQFSLTVGVVLLVSNNLSLAGEYCQHQHKDCDNRASGIKPRKSQQLSDLSTDFEIGSQNFWIDDSSQTGVRWKIENITSSWESATAAPKPPTGRNYMRVDRGATLSFGVAVLRSPTFQIPPSNYNYISISFDFWIRSKWPQFTNLELYLNENGNERLLVSLWNYSDSNNRNWVTYPASFSPLHNDSEFSLAFYAYCGTDVVDAVAIDNIRWTDAPPTTTSSTGTESTTTPIADCSGYFTATPNDTNITSPYYPDSNKVNQTCYFTIAAPSPLGIVRLNFYDIDIGPNDFVKVYDGVAPNSPAIFYWTGDTSVPAPLNPSWPILAVSCESGGCFVEHQSEPSPPNTYHGWSATYSVCGGSYIATEESTTISSPNYPNFNYSNQSCSYSITTLSQTGKIRFEIVELELVNHRDHLTVLDGVTTESPTLFSSTSNAGFPGDSDNKPPTLPHSVNSSGPGILILYSTEGLVYGTMGWSANFKEIFD